MLYHLVTAFKIEPNAGLLKVAWQVFNWFPGVQVFFFISGFLITQSLAQRGDLFTYARNRLLRIYPGLYVCLIVTAFILFLTGFLKLTWSTSQWLLCQMTVIQGWTPQSLRGYGVGNPNGSLWTIAVEIEFYAVMPLLALIKSQQRRRICMLTALGCSLLLAETTNQRFLQVTVLPYLWVFLMGALVFEYRSTILPRLEGRFIWVLAVYLALAPAIVFTHRQILVDLVSLPLLAAIVFSGAYTCRKLAEKLLRKVDPSYGIYLFHMVWLNLAIYMNLPKTSITGLGVVVLTLVSALMSWTLIEKKFLALRV